MNLRAAANAVSTSAASSAGGCESSNSGLCDMATRASVMVISCGEVSGGEVDGGGEGGGDCGGLLGEGRGGDVPVRADDDEPDGMGVEPLLEPGGGIADHRDVGRGVARVTGRCVPVQLGGRPDGDQLH